MSGTMLVGYDIESASECTGGFLQGARALHRELNIPWAIFITGQTMEKRRQDLEALINDPLVTPAQHTYSHILLKTVYMQPGGGQPNSLIVGASLEKIEDEINRTQELFQGIYGKTCRGLTGPWNYYRGLCDRPDILKILDQAGLRWLRCYGRDARDCQPVSHDLKPFFYADQGFPDMLECFLHGYQDDFYWKLFDDRSHGPNYEDYLAWAADYVAEHDLVWSLDAHDHGTPTAEVFHKTKGAWLRAFFEKALARGLRFRSYEEYYQERFAQRPVAPAKK
jgi:peptidoglycan/xylan/chitin deacetylase (PgdA/CDA1 family)